LVRGQFRAGHPVGEWLETLVDTSAVIARQHYDTGGLLDGPNEAWSDAGVPILRETFAHGVRAGRHETWYPDGRPRVAGTFALGAWPLAELGLVSLASPDALASGRPAMDGDDAKHSWSGSVGGGNFPIGTWQRWSADGGIVHIRTFDLAGIPDGRFCEGAVCKTIVAGTGTLTFSDEYSKTTVTMRAGLLHGAHEERDADGKLRLHHTYRDGVLHGPWRERAADGGQTITTYRNGVLHGPWREQADGGQTTGTYCDGQKCGTWTTIDGEKHRTVAVYDAAGEQLSEQQWNADGSRGNGWTKEDAGYYERGELPPAMRRTLRARCLELMKTGDCCESTWDPPPGAIVCKNGPPGRGSK
jgi:antitoxin component YwqK of YwqJK toxin-antitoxin module